MELSKLQYSEKWVEYGFLTEEVLNAQIKAFESGTDQNPEHFRNASFLNWLKPKKSVTDEEIDQFLELAALELVTEEEDKLDETVELLAGSAVRTLFLSPIVSDTQFDSMKERLPAFGDWTKKLIAYEVLVRKLKSHPITPQVFKECLAYKLEFQDNRPLVLLIEQTENVDVLAKFENKGVGKRIKTLATKKLSKLDRASGLRSKS
jgi:hypothetical protein